MTHLFDSTALNNVLTAAEALTCTISPEMLRVGARDIATYFLGRIGDATVRATYSATSGNCGLKLIQLFQTDIRLYADEFGTNFELDYENHVKTGMWTYDA